MTTEKITLEQVIELLPKNVSLHYVDYNESLDGNTKIFAEAMEKGGYAIDESLFEIFSDNEWEGVQYVLDELKEDICRKFDIEENEAEDILQEFDEEIRDEIYNRDDSTPTKDILRNTSPVPVRVSLYSNYDCMNSWWFESQSPISYQESYIGAAIDALNLNPAKVKKMFTEKGVKVCGKWPNLKGRDGKEYVKYPDFWVELENQSCPAVLLTIVGSIDAADFLDIPEGGINKITIPAGNNVGFFSSWQGGGSTIEASLQRPFTIDLKGHKATKYDHWSLQIDGDKESGYGIDYSYGVTRQFWGNNITFN
jgi:hypothetical protein